MLQIKFPKNQKFVFSDHALIRMSQRQINKQLVVEVLFFNRVRLTRKGWRFDKGGLVVITDYKSPYKIIIWT